jgi:Domain of unknown function (DUF397)
MFAASGWRKSTRCETSACVEVDTSGPLVGLRNSTKPDTRLAIDAGAWRDFVNLVKRDGFTA